MRYNKDDDDFEVPDSYFWIDLVFDFCIVGISFAILYFLT